MLLEENGRERKERCHQDFVNKYDSTKNIISQITYPSWEFGRIIDCPFSPLDCIAPVGMESGLISDDQISASSQLDDNHAPKRARLNTKMSGIKQGGWLPLTNDRNQWLQVDLNSYTRVTRVATQGMDGYEQWVTSFQLEYSINEITFKSYMESVGNPKVCGAY